MAIAPRLQRFLADQGVQYDVVAHEPTMSSLGTAHAGHIPEDRLAKGVVLSDGDRYMMAVLPASHHLRLSDLRVELGQEVHLASEAEVEEIFTDCVRGAIPPVGECYGLDVIIDNSLNEHSDFYIEGGDHTTLVHMTGSEFARLNPQAQHGSFSARQ
ncbi:aminoacyl-tRNA deacylase [Microvirga brassicacearum]|uniref:YbaK/EbsC family protein n=1 Tax=Microvirga brassicacearum TaxID=2580413 RepID=A0A5N3P9H2_9HYPH|nr:YbaK/EbsC family protein [Microvirga brassicacearum]KAB0266367.1 YbaK/EbsC family protein [Microvirga brassicacearum]